MNLLKFLLPLLIVLNFLLFPGSITFAQETPQLEGQIVYIGEDNNVWILQVENGEKYQVTMDAGDTIEYLAPRYSPDGTMLAFCQKNTDREVSFNLMITRVGEWQPIHLTSNLKCKPWPNRNYDWSPDGLKILYNHFSENITGEGDKQVVEALQGIWIIDITSGVSSEVVPPPDDYPLLNPQWSPNGQWIKFYQSTYFTGLGSLMTGENSSGTIYTWLGARSLWPGYSDWAPDSTHIAFDEVPYTGFPGAGLYMATPDGENINQIYSSEGNIVTKPLWSPAISNIAFQLKSYSDGTGSLALVAPDGSNPRQVYTSQSYLIPSTWSPEGDQILFGVKNDEGFELIIHDLESVTNTSIGIGATAGTDWSNALIDDTQEIEAVTIPDFPYSDSLLLYVNPDNQLILYDPDDESKLELTKPLAVTSFYPSPNGRHYVYGRHFASIEFLENGDLVVEEILLPSSPVGETINWSTDEQRISYVDWRGNYWIADSDGNAQQIPDAKSLPDWSADSSIISYCVEEDVLRIIGGELETIDIDDNTGCEAYWSPTRNLLAYTKSRLGTAPQVLIYDIESGNHYRVIDNGEVVSWSQDGKYLAIKSKAGTDKNDNDRYNYIITNPDGTKLLDLGIISEQDLDLPLWTLSDGGHYFGHYFLSPDLISAEPISDGLLASSKNGGQLILQNSELTNHVLVCRNTITNEQTRLLTVDLTDLPENEKPGIWSWISPDGSTVITRSFIDGNYANLLFNCYEHGQINLPYGQFPELGEFSDDSNWFIIGRSENGGISQIEVANLSQGSIGRIPVLRNSQFTWVNSTEQTGIHTITGTVNTEENQPLPKTSVFVNGILVTTTNDRGEFTIARLIPGKHEVTAQKPGFHFSPSSYKITVPPDIDDLEFEARKGKLRPTEEPKTPNETTSPGGDTERGSGNPETGNTAAPSLQQYLLFARTVINDIFNGLVVPTIAGIGEVLVDTTILRISGIFLLIFLLILFFVLIIWILRKITTRKSSELHPDTTKEAVDTRLEDTQPTSETTFLQSETEADDDTYEDLAKQENEEEALIAPLPDEQLKEWMDSGIESVKNGDLDEGHRYLRQVVQAKPEEASAWLWLGYISAQKQEYRAAERCFRAAKKYNHPKAGQALEWLEKQQSK